MPNSKLLIALIVLALFVHLKYPQWTFGFLCAVVIFQTVCNVWKQLARRIKQWADKKKNAQLTPPTIILSKSDEDRESEDEDD